MTLLVFFILGLIIGSFLNVVVFRLRLEETLLGRSHCPNCKKQIRWYDNIPVASFIFLKAQCRECGEKISWQYPLVEMGTGLVFLFLSWKFFNPADFSAVLNTLFLLALASLFIVILVYDFQFMEIPMVIVWLAVGLLLAYNLGRDLDLGVETLKNNFWESSTAGGIFAGLAAFAFFYFLVLISKETWMGAGDAYLAAAAGMFLGWPLVVTGLMLAFFVGALAGLALILLGKKHMQSQLPFAPFLILGVWAAFVINYNILSWTI